MIDFQDIAIAFGDENSKVQVAEGLTLTLAQNDFTCILGPSGSGKTTLLNIIAGFQIQDKGEVLINNQPLANSTVKLSYVFQGHNIFPWKTVRQNIAFGLASFNATTTEKNRRVEEVAKDVELFDYLDHYPAALSGGTKQRVGIARALAGEPNIILMDEPFASLDALTALRARELLKKLCKEREVTVVFVTHNIEEALELGDRILVVSKKPMKILMDKKLTDKTRNTSSLDIKLKDRIYNALKSSVSE